MLQLRIYFLFENLSTTIVPYLRKEHNNMSNSYWVFYIKFVFVEYLCLYTNVIKRKCVAFNLNMNLLTDLQPICDPSRRNGHVGGMTLN